MLERISRHFEVLIAVLALAFRESQWDCYLTSRLDTIAPKSVRCDLNGRKRNLSIGISTLGNSGAHIKNKKAQNSVDSFHNVLFLITGGKITKKL